MKCRKCGTELSANTLGKCPTCNVHIEITPIKFIYRLTSLIFIELIIFAVAIYTQATLFDLPLWVSMIIYLTLTWILWDLVIGYLFYFFYNLKKDKKGK